MSCVLRCRSINQFFNLRVLHGLLGIFLHSRTEHYASLLPIQHHDDEGVGFLSIGIAEHRLTIFISTSIFFNSSLIYYGVRDSTERRRGSRTWKKRADQPERLRPRIVRTDDIVCPGGVHVCPPPSHIYGLHTRAAALPLHEKIRVPGANRPSTGCKTGRPKRSIAGFSRAGGKASDDAQARATS